MIEYRKATLADTEELLKIRIDFLRQVRLYKTEFDEKAMRSANRDFLTSSLKDGSFIQHLAVVDGKIAATSSVSLYALPPNVRRSNGKVAYIGNMFTYPEYRRRGLAEKLLGLAVESAKEAGCKEICLDATDMGRSLYEKFGFKNNGDAMSYFIT